LHSAALVSDRAYIIEKGLSAIRHDGRTRRRYRDKECLSDGLVPDDPPV